MGISNKKGWGLHCQEEGIKRYEAAHLHYNRSPSLFEELKGFAST